MELNNENQIENLWTLNDELVKTIEYLKLETKTKYEGLVEIWNNEEYLFFYNRKTIDETYRYVHESLNLLNSIKTKSRFNIEILVNILKKDNWSPLEKNGLILHLDNLFQCVKYIYVYQVYGMPNKIDVYTEGTTNWDSLKPKYLSKNKKESLKNQFIQLSNNTSLFYEYMELVKGIRNLIAHPFSVYERPDIGIMWKTNDLFYDLSEEEGKKDGMDMFFTTQIPNPSIKTVLENEPIGQIRGFNSKLVLHNCLIELISWIDNFQNQRQKLQRYYI
ncbi:hypothetical protein [Mesoplasma lactucae]|uniref:Uncharacterized protein n=1 Tax=Mesoplasma lactucae ATCC 49193 TaxID=81460 RepID=A0A291IRW7_9MOLU|nr:hypothetical protein [Mesoplasma lactucae]ATG97437.1 hypothetical protein CP520_01525 [Mesoplasma lactucae ATCC 49193]ATZ20109.1 hypothetical protein MLACT_v1c02880 [Mesoplasma lactucae ATCC 49193]MCL8216857.1 hypothetical protein [Mesoplasma lactucae ATCC 49193]